MINISSTLDLVVQVDKKPLISICIPTFNRCEQVYKLISNILNYPGNEIEIVLVDNCSTENINLLEQLNDSRICFIKNTKNIGGILNPLKALTSANGTYAFLCLDKDNIDYYGIKCLIDRLSNDQGVVFGHCALNLQTSSLDITYQSGYDSLRNMAYLSAHPTGKFYKTEILKNLTTVKQALTQGTDFGFIFDLIDAEMAQTGNSRIINVPLFYTESKADCAKKPSFTSSAENIFFSPESRLRELFLYIESAFNLQLTKVEFFKLTVLLYRRGLISATFGYRNILNDDKICAHYRINQRKVGLVELLKIAFVFSKKYYKQEVPLSLFEKILSIAFVFISFWLYLPLRFVKKYV